MWLKGVAGMIHPDTELYWAGPAIGFGVRATRDIPRGTLTWVRCALDIVLDEQQALALGSAYAAVVDRYAYLEADGKRVLCWDNGRFINHHCHANSRGIAPGAQIAIRDIPAGEELTCDYGECNLPWTLECACTSPYCRGTIRPDDLDTYAERWDDELAPAIVAARECLQPLLLYVDPDSVLSEILAGQRLPPTIRDLAFRGKSRCLAG